MKFIVTCLGTLLVGVACSSTTALAQEQPKPSPEHRVLRKDVGTWDAKMTITMPGQDPLTAEGVEVNRMLGRSWVVSEYRGKIGDQAFTGRGQFGYHANKKKYVGTWIDNMESYMSTMEGDYDEESKTMTMISTGVDPETGKPRVSKIVTVYKDDDHRTMTMLMDTGDGKYVPSMVIEYTRKQRERKRNARADKNK